MSRRDTIHFEVRDALIRDGWTITHDPFYLDYLTDELQVDLSAERLIAATRGIERIAVEIKTFCRKISTHGCPASDWAIHLLSFTA